TENNFMVEQAFRPVPDRGIRKFTNFRLRDLRGWGRVYEITCFRQFIVGETRPYKAQQKIITIAILIHPI
ncbi:hypothetical protein, partial [Microcoleus sp. F4-D5]|uniref:hypothetical protein n=1 Tax=Microcoleus sp. F4-D5 TaxID=2818760 RepID=UPI002FD10DB8